MIGLAVAAAVDRFAVRGQQCRRHAALLWVVEGYLGDVLVVVHVAVNHAQPQHVDAVGVALCPSRPTPLRQT
ncbi:MAG: hypothetical protein R2856_10315 [Caldilineaceae bacterium]